MSTPHHCQYATVGSKSGSEGGFWTDSDVQVWGSVYLEGENEMHLWTYIAQYNVDIF